MGKRILLLGAYGMEMVECGGVLCQNVKNGGQSHAAILFAGEKMQRDLVPSAKVLGCTIEFLGMDTAEICASVEEKKKVVKVIRTFRPDVIITQDPVHCISDLDPGRRPAMTLLLEAMALAGRAWSLDEETGREPHRGFDIYYMTPEQPNCLVDITDCWEEKSKAMNLLKAQLSFIGELHDTPKDRERMSMMIPGADQMDVLTYGTAIKQQMDLAYHLFYRATGHNPVLLSENYRREGMFVLKEL